MAEIKTKYSIGDRVYRAGMVTERRCHPCPDCKGTRKWKAVSPAGGEYEFECPRCSSGYHGHDDVSLDYSAYAPSVEPLTIGSYRIESDRKEHPVSYMCRETGIGSGTIHYEEDLFPTEAEARAAAEQKCAAANAETQWVVERYNRSVKVSDFQLSDAALKQARDYRASWEVRLQTLFGDLDDCDTIDGVRDVLERFRERKAA